MVSLVSGIVDDVQDLITQQVKLTRAEITSDVRKATDIAIAFAIGGSVMLVGAILACLMLVYLLHWATSPNGSDPATVPLWACYGIVGAAFCVVGALIVAAAKKRFDSTTLVPEQSAAALKENLECLVNKK